MANCDRHRWPKALSDISIVHELTMPFLVLRRNLPLKKLSTGEYIYVIMYTGTCPYLSPTSINGVQPAEVLDLYNGMSKLK